MHGIVLTISVAYLKDFVCDHDSTDTSRKLLFMPTVCKNVRETTKSAIVQGSNLSKREPRSDLILIISCDLSSEESCFENKASVCYFRSVYSNNRIFLTLFPWKEKVRKNRF